ncbi:MAG: 1,2-phenylacetyl-CoA epoxidase subunit PaaD [Planifilum fimeticola]
MSDNRDALWQALQEVKDPEIPTISLVDLGMIHRLRVEGDRVTVEILPTFVGCPALDIIRRDVRKRLLQVEGVADVEVKFVYHPPWTSERITEEGRKRLASFGIAPPRPAGDNPMDIGGEIQNLFGPTACRSIFYCRRCRQPFEGMKPV